jgi:RNase adapter protein RapZ
MSTEIILVTGMSGSGKSVALHALEDMGYYCVDNLPPSMLKTLVDTLEQDTQAPSLHKLAIAMDVRNANALPRLPEILKTLKADGMQVRSLFLDANTDTLVHRFSESRRIHPLAQASQNEDHVALIQAIELERELLSGLRETAIVIDTSFIRSAQLLRHLKEWVAAPARELTLVFQSFAFKRGIPVDADFVFDVRMLPNPHYEPELRALTGKDAEVSHFLHDKPLVIDMQNRIADFVSHWLKPIAQDNRQYVTVAIGCTGGQHRSVYLVEQLAKLFAREGTVLIRHRELDSH